MNLKKMKNKKNPLPANGHSNIKIAKEKHEKIVSK
jgi:hypothetical protein